MSLVLGSSSLSRSNSSNNYSAYTSPRSSYSTGISGYTSSARSSSRPTSNYSTHRSTSSGSTYRNTYEPSSYSRSNLNSARHYSSRYWLLINSYFTCFNNSNFITLRSWKAGRFEKMFSFGSSHPNVTRGFLVSRAPPGHTHPRFFKSSLKILHGRKKITKKAWNF